MLAQQRLDAQSRHQQLEHEAARDRSDRSARGPPRARAPRAARAAARERPDRRSPTARCAGARRRAARLRRGGSRAASGRPAAFATRSATGSRGRSRSSMRTRRRARSRRLGAAEIARAAGASCFALGWRPRACARRPPSTQVGGHAPQAGVPPRLPAGIEQHRQRDRVLREEAAHLLRRLRRRSPRSRAPAPDRIPARRARAPAAPRCTPGTSSPRSAGPSRVRRGRAGSRSRRRRACAARSAPAAPRRAGRARPRRRGAAGTSCSVRQAEARRPDRTFVLLSVEPASRDRDLHGEPQERRPLPFEPRQPDPQRGVA